MVKPALVQLHLDSLPTDDLPNTVWTYGEMGDRSYVLTWQRIGGGWRTAYPNGVHSGAISTRAMRRDHSRPSAAPLTPTDA